MTVHKEITGVQWFLIRTSLGVHHTHDNVGYVCMCTHQW